MSGEWRTAELSQAGRTRRGEILAAAQRIARRRRIGRLTRRGVLACAVLAAGTWASESLRKPHSSPPPQQAHMGKPESRPTVVPAPPRRKPAEIVIERVTTDSTLATQWATPKDGAAWQRLDDDALLQQLAAAGKPAGLAHVDGHARVVYRSAVH